MKRTNTLVFKKIAAATVASLFFFMAATAQITIDTISVTDATCTSNGSIAVVASGGSGSYSYQLFSDTCQTTPPQNSLLFNNLEPCVYTIVVTDGQTGQTASQTIMVGGHYAPPELSLICGACSITASVQNGLLPFKFAISTTGPNGPWTLNMPPDANTFQNLVPGTTYWVKVTDDCENEAIVQCTTGGSATITDFSASVFSDGNLHIYNVQGGTQPYLYTLQSSAGTFTNNTGIFPPGQWGCNIKVTVSDGCTEFTEPFTPPLYLTNFCTNFADETATMDVAAVPPFTVTCYTPSGNFFSTTGSFTGLPINVAYYSFGVTDACGNSLGDWSYRFYPNTPAFPQTPIACSDTTLRLMALVGHCQDGTDTGNLPLSVSCLSCVDTTASVIGTVWDTISFNGNQPGNWELALEDDCGDHFVCRDSLVLHLEPYCDSLRATIVDRFFCDNGYFSDRPMLVEGVMFYLLDESGAVKDSNTAGFFTGLAPGKYTVQVAHPDCGAFEESTEVGIVKTLDTPVYVYDIKSLNYGGKCRIVYGLIISPSLGKLLLTGNGIQRLLDENDLIHNCLWYRTNDLPPGEYELSALGFCWSKTIKLPVPKFDLQATANGDCPGAGTVTASGAQTLAYWQDWAIDSNLHFWSKIWWGDFVDHYGLDGQGYGNFAQSDSPFTFYNVPPGNHTVYLYAFNSTCPVDTVTINVPPPPPSLTMNWSDGIICDGQTSTDLTLNIFGGKPPYTVLEVDCADFSAVLGSFAAYNSQLTVPDVTLGDHCYLMKDSCGTSLDKQLSVQHYQDSIEVTYNCNNTVTLTVDSITAIYTWKNTAGNELGNSRRLTVPNPDASTVFFVFIDIGPCIIKRSVTVFPTPIIPNVAITGEPLQYLCEGDTIALNAISDTDVFLWNTGATTPQIEIAQSGSYSVTVTNNFNCTATDTVLVKQVSAIVALVLGDTSVCPGIPNRLWVEGIFTNILWSNGIADDSILTAVPGVYRVSVTDVFGCVWEGEAEVTEHISPVPVISGKTSVCEGASAQLSLSQPFAEYAWSNGSSQPSIAAGKGSYSVTVTDDNGCLGDTTFVVTEIPTVAIRLSGDTLLCYGEQAQLHIATHNNTADAPCVWLSGLLLPTPIQYAGQDTTLSFPVFQNTVLWVDSVWLKDYDCPFDLPDAVMIAVDKAEVTVEATSDYHGYSVSCHGESDAAACAEPLAGIPPFSFEWSNQAKTPTLEGLPAGEYVVVLTDSLGCRASDTVTLTQPGPLIPQIALEPPWCFGVDDGWAALSGWSGGAGQARAWLDGGYAAALPLRFERLSPGDYQLHLEDNNGCPYDTAFYFPEPLLLTLDLGEDLTLPLGDSVRLSPVTNFSPVDSFGWHPMTYLQNDGLEPFCKPLQTILYRLQVWDEHGCPAEDALLVRVDKTLVLYAPNVFSPNGDGGNDYFTLFAKASSVRTIRSLRIFDRWGNQVFVNQNFPPNEEQLGWDGNFRGRAMNPAVFAWVTVVEFIDGRVLEFTGDVTLLR